MINSLTELAEEGTDAAWSTLFVKLCEFVISEIDQRTSRELAIFAELTIKLYELASHQDRMLLAQNLAGSPKTPSALARRLGEDNISIAEPILAHSPVFSQTELLDLVERLSSKHLQVIARRSDLGAEVSDALLRNGDKPVYRILAANRNVQLSRETMLTFVKQAAKDAVMREDLALRSDLTPGICQQLLPLVGEDTKKRLHKIIEGALSQDQLEQIARLKSLRRELGQVLEITDMKLLWSDAERAHVRVDDLTILLLQDGRFNHVIELLADRGRIAKSAFKDAVFSGKRDIVLKTAVRTGLQLHTFSLFVKARCAHLKIPATQSAEWIGAYAALLKSTKGNDNRCTDFQAKRKERPSTPLSRPVNRLSTA